MNNNNQEPTLQRKITLRQLYRIAIGSGIGTGLYLSSGATVGMAGPGGAIAAYSIIAIAIYVLMHQLAEMTTFMPVTGAYEAQGTRYVEPAMGFALGWNYWFGWAVTIALELQAGAMIMKYWFPETPSIVWSATLLLIIFCVNLISVKVYGETEYWLSSIKLGTVIIFIVVGILMIVGILGRDSAAQAAGFANFSIGDAPFVGGLMGIFSVLITAAFAFSGTEMVAVTAGEVENPKVNVPKAMKAIIWRLIIFFIVSITIIAYLIPYNNENLLTVGVDNIAISPYTLVFEGSGIPFAADIMNAIILIAVLSVTNSGIYLTSRMMYAMARTGKAPKVLGKVNKRGIPVLALCASTAIASLCFLSSIYEDGTIFFWLLNMAAVTCFIAWIGIAICHYRFRRGYVRQGYSLDNLSFKAKFFPYGTIYLIAVCVICLISVSSYAFMGGPIDWFILLTPYSGLVIFTALFVGYKVVKKSKYIKLDEIVYFDKDSNLKQNED